MVGSQQHVLGHVPGLTHGAMSAIQAHGTAEQKDTYLSKLTVWPVDGTMCLRSPLRHRILGIIKTRAVPRADGSSDHRQQDFHFRRRA